MTDQPDVTPAAPRMTATQLALAIGLALTVVVILLLRLRALPVGLPGEWQWPWREPRLLLGTGGAVGLLASLAGAVLVGLALKRPRPLTTLHTALLLAALVAVSCACVGGLMSDNPLGPVEVPSVAVSVAAMGYYDFAKAAPSLEALFRYFSGASPVELGLPGPPGRVATHPPGPVIFSYYGIKLLEVWPAPVEWARNWLQRRHGIDEQVIFEAMARHWAMPSITPSDLVPAALLALATTFLGCLLPLPAYLLGRELFGKTEGLIAALLAATLPSLLAFTPSIDGLAAALACLATALALLALRTGWWLHAALAGLALAAGVYWTAGVGAVVIVTAIMALWHASGCRAGATYPAAVIYDHQSPRGAGYVAPALQSETRLKPALTLLIILGATALLFGLMRLCCDYDLLGNLRQISHEQRREMQWGARQYFGWMPMNLYDFILFMGPMLVSLVVAGALRLRGEPRAFLAAVGLTLALVLLSGSTRGEVGRIWLLFMPLFAVFATRALNSLARHELPYALAVATLCQFGLAFTLFSTLRLVSP